jgi:hypothetical protein
VLQESRQADEAIILRGYGFARNYRALAQPVPQKGAQRTIGRCEVNRHPSLR